MSHRRGLLAELQHQSQLAARRKAQTTRDAQRKYAAAVRNAEAAQRYAQRAQAEATRAASSQQKEQERVAARLQDEYLTAQAAAQTAEVEATLDEIDSILQATLGLDDYVDLDLLRIRPVLPPFPHPELQAPLPPPAPLAAPPGPQWIEPPVPKGFGSKLGGKKKHDQELARGRAQWEAAHGQWRAYVASIPGQQLGQLQDYQAAEQERQLALANEQRRHRKICDVLAEDADQANEGVDQLVAGLEAGEQGAVTEYVGIVLANSVYPESFTIEHDYSYLASARELTLVALVPPPSSMPTQRGYRYVKSTGEIRPTQVSATEHRSRYASAVHQVAIRSLHEIFEADRRGWIRTISLTVAVETLDPATGLPRRIPLAVVASDRETFEKLNLANIVPAATLAHLGALLSKNPSELISVETTRGVRSR